MVEISNPDMKELVVHHVYKISRDDLMKNCLTPSGAVRPLYWCDGCLFFYYTFPPETHGIVDDYLKGREHWVEVYYTDSNAYEPMLDLESEHFKGIKIRVMDVSGFTPHKEFVKWLRSSSGAAKKR